MPQSNFRDERVALAKFLEYGNLLCKGEFSLPLAPFRFG